MSRRVIIHADINNCYASIEMLHYPRLKGRPVAVGGNAELRHGIILAKNYEAKAYGIQVGMALWQARQRCPDLIILPPDYDKYLRFTRLFRGIMSDYSDQIEPFGLDESWADLTASSKIYGSGEDIANTIRERAKSELGITVSIGVSFNKIFAKLGSDIRKPDKTTVISEDNFKDIVWPLPAEDLLGVGRSTQARFRYYGVNTIGDIANTPPETLRKWFGKWGLFLYTYANGLDNSAVKAIDYEAAVKSIGNSSTCPRDLENNEDAHIVFLNLAESVAERMRDLGVMARTVQISLRSNDLEWIERQAPLPAPSMIATELTDAAMKLIRTHYTWEKPLRGIGIRGTNLVPVSGARQLSVFGGEERRRAMERLEYAIDDIRRRYGYFSIGRALTRVDAKLGRLDAKSDNVIHPVGYL